MNRIYRMDPGLEENLHPTEYRISSGEALYSGLLLIDAITYLSQLSCHFVNFSGPNPTNVRIPKILGFLIRKYFFCYSGNINDIKLKHIRSFWYFSDQNCNNITLSKRLVQQTLFY